MNKSAVSISKKLIGWEKASMKAKNWWEQLEDINSDKQDLVLKLVSELLYREATIEDFYTACSYSGREGVTENLIFLDMIKQDRLSPVGNYNVEKDSTRSNSTQKNSARKKQYTIH